jgi:predicted nucleic acid-binding Zn ribbon protein
VIRDVDGRFTGELPERPGPTSSVRDLVALVLKQNGIGGDPSLRRAVAAWREAAGGEFCEQTRVTDFKKGVLTVTVDSAALLQELSVYRKKELLVALRAKDKAIADVKFKPGPKGRKKGAPG